MYIDLATINMAPGQGGGGKTEVSLVESIVSNGDYSYTPDPGEVYNSVSIAVSVPQKTEREFITEIYDNGNYSYTPDPGEAYNSVTIRASVHPSVSLSETYTGNGVYTVSGEFSGGEITVAVPGGQQADRSYRSGSITGLSDLGWTAGDISIAQDNIDIYSNITVPSANKVYTSAVLHLGTEDRFRFNDDIEFIPKLDLSGVGDPVSLFEDYHSLIATPGLNISADSTTDIHQMFKNCYNLVTVGQLGDTSAVTNMLELFYNCRKLKNIPDDFDTSGVVNMSSMFMNTGNLDTIPAIDTGSATDMTAMFRGSGISSIPLLNTSSNQSFWNMFYDTKNLSTIPAIDTSSGTNFNGMFYGSGIRIVPPLDTRQATSMNGMFRNTTNIVEIQGVDLSNLLSFPTQMFNGGTYDHLRRFIVNGSINWTWNSANNGLDKLTYIGFDSYKSIFKALINGYVITPSNQGTIRFSSSAKNDINGYLAGLKSQAAALGWNWIGNTSFSNVSTDWLWAYRTTDGKAIYPGDEYTTEVEITFGSNVRIVDSIDADADVTGDNTTQYFITIGYPSEVGYFAGKKTLTRMDLPNSITSILPGCFAGCENLEAVVINYDVSDTDLCSIDESAFIGCPATYEIQVPDAYVNAYKERYPNLASHIVSSGN